MNLSKKQFLAIVAVISLLATSTFAFAALYITKSASITGGVATVGDITLFEEDGITEWTSFDFPLCEPFEWSDDFFTFSLNNTGNTPVYVTWNISASDITWYAVSGGGYLHDEEGITKYIIRIWNDSQTWAPSDDPEAPGVIYLDVGDSVVLLLNLTFRGTVAPSTPETFSVTLSFYAADS